MDYSSKKRDCHHTKQPATGPRQWKPFFTVFLYSFARHNEVLSCKMWMISVSFDDLNGSIELGGGVVEV